MTGPPYRPIAAAVFACALSALGCGADDDAAERDAAPATTAGQGGAGGSAAGVPACDPRTTIFPVLCATSICHDGAINGLDLISPGVDQRVLDAPAKGTGCSQSGLRIVDSQQPDSSLLLQKLTEHPPCGSPMPLGSGPKGLTAGQLACIQDYVRTLTAR